MSGSVFVSGCFDLLHMGHVAFLEAAAQLGELTVSVGSDRTIAELKGRPSVMNDHERVALVRALRCVDEAFIAGGTGMLDFADELQRRRPNVFVVNDDGDCPAKRELCQQLGIDYVVLSRKPAAGLPARSASGLRRRVAIPYRVDLAGGWLDQPFVSQVWPGPVVVASVEAGGGEGESGRLRDEELQTRDGLGRPSSEKNTARDGLGRPSSEEPALFDERSGMATSTRETAMRLWGPRLPVGDPVEVARLLFGAENPPGKLPVAGSQDALGICLPGISRLDYSGGYWPERVESINEDGVSAWLEKLIWLVPLGPRGESFDVLGETRITPEKARRLAEAAHRAWASILARDAEALGAAVWDSFQAQVSMFPAMTNSHVEAAVAEVRPRVLGCKLTGAGGGGYVLAIAREPPPGARGVRLRRRWF